MELRSDLVEKALSQRPSYYIGVSDDGLCLQEACFAVVELDSLCWSSGCLAVLKGCVVVVCEALVLKLQWGEIGVVLDRG